MSKIILRNGPLAGKILQIPPDNKDGSRFYSLLARRGYSWDLDLSNCHDDICRSNATVFDLAARIARSMQQKTPIYLNNELVSQEEIFVYDHGNFSLQFDDKSGLYICCIKVIEVLPLLLLELLER